MDVLDGGCPPYLPKILSMDVLDGRVQLKIQNWRLSLSGMSFRPPPGWIMAAMKEMSTMLRKSPGLSRLYIPCISIIWRVISFVTWCDEVVVVVSLWRGFGEGGRGRSEMAMKVHTTMMIIMLGVILIKIITITEVRIMIMIIRFRIIMKKKKMMMRRRRRRRRRRMEMIIVVTRTVS